MFISASAPNFERMKSQLPFFRFAAGLMAFAYASRAVANPTGLSVAFGTAIAQQTGSQLSLTVGNNAVLNWSSFNIAAGEKTIFNQPSSTSIVWNRINDPSPSQIFGTIQANGVVVLLNSSGFYFGPNSFVSAAGLVVSTANVIPPQNGGGSWEFNGPPPLASIVNYGHIQVGNAGSAFLIADQIENHGDIEAPGGSIGLAAGQTVTLSESPDGRGMSLQVKLPQGSVSNYGNIIADAGTIALNAQVVNQNGLVQADSVQNNNGVIELVASDTLNLGASSQIVANGDNSVGGSAGGTVTIQAGNTFSDTAGSQVYVAGGANGGNGGNIEIAAPNLSLNSTMSASAQNGGTAGQLLLSPYDIILDTSGTDSAGNGTILVGNSLTGSLDLNVSSAFANFSQITLQATHNITLANGTIWDLSGTTGQTSGQLTLEAGNNILFQDGSQIYDANNWAVTLKAGYNFINNTVQSGVGSIYLGDAVADGSGNLTSAGGSGSIQLAAGAIDLTAGQDITLGSGYVITTAGGNISAHALAGNIDAASSLAQGYYFESSVGTIKYDPSLAYDLSQGLGGISTAAGGDVALVAGGNVSSFLPGPSGAVASYTAGVGAYGQLAGEAGNVTVVAGGNVTGQYVIANGSGNISAGVKMDANGNPLTDGAGKYLLGASGSAGTDQLNPNLALCLVSGGWNVNAAQNIILQEVRNPNGEFNVSGGAAYNHYFDYALNDYVNLNAGNLVQLGGSASALPRVDSLHVPIIYPSSLNITAGAGGVLLDSDTFFNQLILFPSPAGGLTISTSQGGSLFAASVSKDANGTIIYNPFLSGGAPQLYDLVVSDSGSSQYKGSSSFGLNETHAGTPIHLNNPTPIELNIAGDMNLVLLDVPEAAQVKVGGDMNNCSFKGMNLSASDTTRINVTGNINNRSDFTSIDLSQVSGAQVPDFSLVLQAVSSSPSPTTLATSFYYDSATHTLTYQNIKGVSLASVLKLLENLTIQVYVNGVPQWLDLDQTIPETTVVHVLNAATAKALLAEYNSLGASPAGAIGYVIGGGGHFEISANNLDLGNTPGIQSMGIGLYKVGSSYPLANPLGADITQGADVLVNLTGNLLMYSSSIASLNGGSIYVNAGGDINVGSSVFVVNTLGARGIYATDQGNVAVYAQGNIDVNGSRIASYDLRPVGPTTTGPGGSVTVVSRNGNINAGSGGSGFVNVSAYEPTLSAPFAIPLFATIPGSGILETTYTSPGNTLVEAPNGSINAGAGGIPQLPLTHPVPSGTDLFGLYSIFGGQDYLEAMFHLALNGQAKAALNLQAKLNGNVGNSQLDVYAGYELQQLNNGIPVVDAYGNSVVNATSLSDGTLVKTSIGQNIDATGSGVIGAGSVTLDASGSISGNVFALNNVNINAVNNVNVSVLGLGNVSVSSTAGSISGTIIGVGGVSASGSSIDANLESNGSVSGSTSGEKGMAAGTAADATATAASASDDLAKATKQSNSSDDTEDPLKKKKGIALAQKVSRVTVLLPAKN